MIEIVKFIENLFLSPTIVIVVLLVVLSLLRKEKKRLAHIILITTVGFLYIFSIEPTAYILNQTLERSTPLTFEKISSKMGSFIVILAGGVTHSNRNYGVSELGGASSRRFLRGIELYYQLEKKVPVLYTGHSSPTPDYGKQESILAQQYAMLIGIPSENFLIDQESKTTYESAMFVREFFDQKFPNEVNPQIFLVTSAQHMPRSLEIFQRKGIEVVPIVADFSGKMAPLT